MAEASNNWPSALPARLIPARGPPWWQALAVTVALTALAWGARVAVLGLGSSAGVTVTFYPAVILITLYADAGWGLACLAFAAGLSWWALSGLAGAAPAPNRIAALVLFVPSGLMTVLVCSALRRVVRTQRDLLGRSQAAEAALARSEASLRLAQEAGGVGFWDWDLVNATGYWSPAIYSTIGLDPSEPASPRRLIEFVHPDDQDRVRQMNSGVAREGVVESVEYRVVRPDGVMRWVLSRGDSLKDETGRVTRAFGVIIDITERRIAMERLAESEARFRAMADSAPALMWVTKLDGKREFVNAAYLEFLGMPADEAVAFDWRGRIHPDDLPRILVEQRAAEAMRGAFTLEARYGRADGEWRWLKSRSQARFDPDGAFLGFIGIAFDDTDAKKAQNDLEHINDLLHERVAAALAERDRAQAALAQAQRLEAIGRLTGGVAHDFNNLLTVIIGALDILQRNPDDTQRRARLIEAAVTAARRGERLNQQLLAFSRRQPLRPELAAIDTVLGEAEPLLRRAVGDAVKLTFALGAGAGLARLDVAQFESAVMNLLVNARDALPGGGAIAVTTRPLTLAEPRGEAGPGDYVCVSVRDDGEGMDPEVAAQAFEPFFTTKAVGKGAGLGLSQVYGFARQSGGTAEIETAPGQGTTVRLLLPLAVSGESIPPPETAEAAARPQAGRVQVLLVEDDAEVGDLVAAMLDELGHGVVRAADADEALATLAARADIELMMTDVVMPGARNGLELAAEVARRRPGLPIILISGYIGEALGDAEAAPWPLLKKPFPLTDLAHAVSDAAGS